MIDIYEVVRKLIGPINPVGDSHLDAQRIENMKAYVNLAEKICMDIQDIASNNKDSPMHSVKKIGKIAQDFIRVLEDRQCQSE
jgi:hypothetical protein